MAHVRPAGIFRGPISRLARKARRRGVTLTLRELARAQNLLLLQKPDALVYTCPLTACDLCRRARASRTLFR